MLVAVYFCCIIFLLQIAISVIFRPVSATLPLSCTCGSVSGFASNCYNNAQCHVALCTSNYVVLYYSSTVFMYM